MTARVFAVQQPSRLITQTDGSRKWVAIQDLTPARAFGPLHFLLQPGNIFRDQLYQAQAVVTRALRQNKFDEEDYLLPVGDPIAIALSTMVASNITGGRLNLLKYMPRTQHYEPYALTLEGNPYYARDNA
jgi:hypothetical protein